ncbi:MAG: hypothetical protein JXR76_29495 [Deltaproteobacteria bacterium]|nr:hypothetical protein [Deltaproteobacteria bacterium]
MTIAAGAKQFNLALKMEDNFKPIDLETYKEKSVKPREYEYYCQIFLRLKEYLPDEDYTFYVTDSWAELPSYGKNVFVILHGIGPYWYPAYADKVGAVFRNYGNAPDLFLGSGSVALDISSVAKYVRDLITWTPSRLRGVTTTIGRGCLSSDNVFSIPLGYAHQHNIHIDTDSPRKYDIAFVGSVAGREYSNLSIKAYLQPPKSLARQRMADVAERIQQKYSDINVYLKATKSFEESFSDQGRQYSSILADTKISLVPRGDVLESFRYFESMRYGCVVVCEPQPELWFYTNSPAIEVKNWDDAENIIVELLKHPDRLKWLQKQSLEYWNDICSEEAISLFMARKISTILHGGQQF